MSREITVTVYSFAELSDRAKEKVRDRYREYESQDFDPEFLIDETLEVLKAMGFDVSNRRSATKPMLYWSLNPDRAGFDATWSATRVDDAAIAKIKADRPKDTKLHTMLDDMLALAESAPDAYATVSSGRDGWTPRVESFDLIDHGEDEEAELAAIMEGNAESTLSEIVREVCRQFACAVSAEYDYRMSNEAIDESIECNEGEFYADGRSVLK